MATKRAIVKYGTSVLLEQAAQLVTDFGPLSGLEDLIEDMFLTMYAASGVGLAATQLGVTSRVAVVDISAGEEPEARIVLINPEIKKRRGEMEVEEGCLSIPGRKEMTTRSAEVLVEAQNAKGELFTVWGKGLLSQALQHEIDHLNGILFLKHVAVQK
jgi:peptide deformylase